MGKTTYRTRESKEHVCHLIRQANSLMSDRQTDGLKDKLPSLVQMNWQAYASEKKQQQKTNNNKQIK